MNDKTRNIFITTSTISLSLTVLSLVIYYVYRYYRSTHPSEEEDETDNFTNSALPRPVRNNNPLNIRLTGEKWLGKISNDKNTDGEFEQFYNTKWGIRAAMIDLRTYYNRYHCRTIEQIINRWAPLKENNTSDYVKHVAARMNISPNDELQYDKQTWCSLVAAMAVSEGAGQLTDTQLTAAWEEI